MYNKVSYMYMIMGLCAKIWLNFIALFGEITILRPKMSHTLHVTLPENPSIVIIHNFVPLRYWNTFPHFPESKGWSLSKPRNPML